MSSDPQTELWRKYLRRDPTRFLLDSDADPSVQLWYLIDLAHRPEDSAAVLETRDRVLFSPPVQAIFAAQKEEGNWGSPEALSKPYYSSTLWNLALLAELGIPRDSRRARAGCEFALENFLEQDGRFAGLDLVESGYLIHALAYFRLQNDPRLLLAARRMIQLAQESGSIEGRVMALWALTNLRQDAAISSAADRVLEQLLNSLWTTHNGTVSGITFPPFDPRDPLFVARVLSSYKCASDTRAAQLIDRIISMQDELGQWPLTNSLNGKLIPYLEADTEASRWATLNALRVILDLVMSKG